MTSDALRKKARCIAKHVGYKLFIRAQKNICPICEQRIHQKQDISIDHVYSIYEIKKGRDVNYGNLLIVHALCNGKKGNRPPTAYEKEMLEQVNTTLQYDPVNRIYGVTSYAHNNVIARIHSLDTRRNRIDFNCKGGELESARLNFQMLTMQIEGLYRMMFNFEKVFNGY